MNKKYNYKLILSTLVGVLLIGCLFRDINRQKAVKNVTVELTERQKQVLRIYRLPEEYNKLVSNQKEGIYQIGKSIEYMEAKYNIPFRYIAYNARGDYGKHAVLTPRYVHSEKLVRVKIDWENNQYIYTDDFDVKLAEDIYPLEAKEFLVKYLKEEDFKVFADILELKPEGRTVVERTIGGVFIFVRNKYSEAEIEETAKEYVKWVSSLKGEPRGAALMVVMGDEKFSKVNNANYEDYLKEDIYQVMGHFGDGGEVSTTWYRRDANGKRIYE